MLYRRLHIVLATALLVLCTSTHAAAQTTIDLDEIRRQSEDEGDDEAESDEPEDTAIRIDSVGGTSTSSFGGDITLNFDERGSSMLVPATVGGKSVYFVFDTGASFTTLTPSFAASIGARPPSNAPSTTSRTANGMRRFTFGIIPELKLDGRAHRDITYGACSACGGIIYKGKPVVGLLGLNVLRRYRIDYDHSAGEVRLAPGSRFSDRTHDVAPWLEVSRHTPDTQELGNYKAAFRVANRAPRDAQVALEIHCRFSDGSRNTLQTDMATVPSGGDAIITASTGRKVCRATKIDVARATW